MNSAQKFLLPSDSFVAGWVFFRTRATGAVLQLKILFLLCVYTGTSMEAKLKELRQKLEKQCQINQELQIENQDLGKRDGLIK